MSALYTVCFTHSKIKQMLRVSTPWSFNSQKRNTFPISVYLFIYLSTHWQERQYCDSPKTYRYLLCEVFPISFLKIQMPYQSILFHCCFLCLVQILCFQAVILLPISSLHVVSFQCCMKNIRTVFHQFMNSSEITGSSWTVMW